MKLSCSILIPLIATLAFTACAENPTEETDLFVAMIMTKAQQASSIPTDSGILMYEKDSSRWKRLGPKIQMISSATVDPSDSNTLFLACGNGIVRSQDGGETWRMTTGWRESDVLQIAIDPSNSKLVYAATAWGVIISKDSGDTWKASNHGLPEYFSKGIVIDHQDTTRLLLATTTGLFESNDRAGSWDRITPFPKVAALRLRRSEENPDFWIAGTEGQGVWISKDDGESWEATAPALKDANVYGVAVDPHQDSNLAAGGWTTGVHLSNDSGKTWKQVSPEFPSANITSVVFDANVPHRLWASTFEEGTFYTDDMGANWTNADLDGAYVFDLGFLPKSVKLQ
ncbi:MAG: hypothetical protein P8L44_15570 [Opitutales bacterium]|nr:hypothetical protein [Opitutales bacterium]